MKSRSLMKSLNPYTTHRPRVRGIGECEPLAATVPLGLEVDFVERFFRPSLGFPAKTTGLSEHQIVSSFRLPIRAVERRISRKNPGQRRNKQKLPKGSQGELGTRCHCEDAIRSM